MDEDKTTSQPIDEEALEPTNDAPIDQEADENDSAETNDTEDQQEPEDNSQAPQEAEDRPPSRRENLRIQKLISRMKQQSQTPQQQKDNLDYRQMLDADDQVYGLLDQDRQQFGQRQYHEGLRQAESLQFHTRLEIDSPKVSQRYKVFDQTSSEFNPVAANAINEWYLTTSGYDSKTNTVSNPNIRYSDFVDGIMELADEIAGQKVQTSKRNIAQQASRTGLRPDGRASRGLDLTKAPGQMSDAELDAVIGKVFKK